MEILTTGGPGTALLENPPRPEDFLLENANVRQFFFVKLLISVSLR
jgi:hypothetical protein